MGLGEFCDAVNRLRSEKLPQFVSLDIPMFERAHLSTLDIQHKAEHDCFTAIHRLTTDLPIILKEKMGSVDDASNHIAASIIFRIAELVVKASQKETAWVCIRSFVPTSEYDVPRWHVDGSYYEPVGLSQIKFCSVLKGAPTLFASIDFNKRKDFLRLFDHRIEESARRAKTLALISHQAISSAAPFEGAFFIAGSDDVNNIHSEPPIKESRLFFSVVPGTEAEIRELALRWKKPI